MKIVRTLFFIPVLCLSLSTIIVLNGDDSDLPSFLRRTLDSKGQLSMSVEAIQDSSALQKELSAGLPVLDDVPFNKESSSSLLEEIPLEEKQVTKKEKEILAQENIKAIGKNTAIEKKVQKEQIKKSVDQEQEIIEQKSEKKLPVQESIVLSDKEKNELEKIEQEDEEVVFNFENADLSKLVSYVEMLFGVT
ncbi:hypothetical protein KAH94_06650, partial [bacterium]|nr:hypothetical protein [bacterium]